MKFRVAVTLAVFAGLTAAPAFAQTPVQSPAPSLDDEDLPPPPEVILPVSRLKMDGWYPIDTPGLQRPAPAVPNTVVGQMMGAFYPTEARRHNQQGMAAVEMCVSANGRTEKVGIFQSTGFASLDAVSIQMLQQMPLKPAQLAGKAVPVCGYVFYVSWSLRKPDPPPAKQ